MGAGISKEHERQAKYRRLKSVQRELERAGIACSYRDREVRPADGSTTFQVYFGQTLRASNGEAFGVLVVKVGGETYSVHSGGFGAAEKGIEKIKELRLPDHLPA